MKQKSIKVNMILNLIKTLMGLIFPLITFPYTSRVLGPDGIGKVTFSQSIIGYFALISSFGIGTYAIREVSKVRDNREKTSILSLEILLLNLLTTLIAYVFFAIVMCSVPSLFDYRMILLICSLSMPFTTIGMDWLYVANEDYLYITIRSIIFQIISLVLLFILVRTHDDYINYAILIIISTVGSNILNFIHSRKYVSFNYIKYVNVKQHIKPILVFFITALTSTFHTLIDQTMLGFMKGDTEVGLYVTSIKISHIVITLICAVSGILFPRFAYLYKNGSQEEVKRLLYRVIDFLLLITIPCSIGLTVLRTPTIHMLAGSQFDGAIPVLAIMNFMVIAVCFSNIFGNQVFMAINKEKWTLFSVIIASVVNLLLNVMLIPYFGAIGAALASVSSEMLAVFIQIYLVSKIYNLRSLFSKLMQYSILSVLMAILLVIFRNQWTPESPIIDIMLYTSVGVVFYIGILVVQKNDFVSGLFKQIYKKVESKV